jgi:hypothetical protein
MVEILDSGSVLHVYVILVAYVYYLITEEFTIHVFFCLCFSR